MFRKSRVWLIVFLVASGVAGLFTASPAGAFLCFAAAGVVWTKMSNKN